MRGGKEEKIMGRMNMHVLRDDRLSIGKTSIGESIANGLSKKGRKMDGTETTRRTT